MFDIISDSFFAPLASPNKRVYWECICRLFSIMNNQLSFGVERDVLADELQYYFEQANAADLAEEELEGTDSRGKANFMLRRLEHYGWIEIETDKSYVQRVNFKEYAVKIIRTLLEIAEGKQIEYQGYIYTIYSLVRSSTDHPGVVLMQILENTDLLITGLKNLNSGIKHYIDDLTRHKTVAQIMDALFNDYITNIVDRAYHRLLTSDNVSKFRPEIIERLENKSRSKTYVDKTAAEIAGIKEISKEAAEELVYHYLHSIIDAFQNMDDILREINQKNTQYQRSAVNRARFMLTGSEDVRGQIKEILIGINEKITEEQMNPGGVYRIDFLEELIRIYSVGFLDERSFYAPVEGRKEFNPGEVTDAEPDLAMRQMKLCRMAEKMQKVLSVAKINAYVRAQLGEKRELSASQFPLGDTEDFVPGIDVTLFGESFKWNIIGYDSAHGGLPYFCAYMTAMILGECINFPIQKCFVFRSKGGLGRQIAWYLSAFVVITCIVNSINCVWVAVAGLLVPDFIYNIGTTVLNGGISMVIFFFVNKMIFPEGEAAK